VVDDLGSGALLDTAAFGLAHEPMVTESLRAGAALVAFSGDKLLGGPQAGLIVGRKALVEKIKKHPLARAVRADKLVLAALAATLGHYLKDEAVREVPLWRMIALPLGEIEARAQRWQAALHAGAVIAGESTVGGGSLPGETLPTRLLALAVKAPNAFAARLRERPTPIIARVAAEGVVFDPRTVATEEDDALLAGLRQALNASPP
jgi:L-seryl-tRNA(Ser) seleniumtransferase